MANELRKRADFVAGGLTLGISATDTTMSSPGLMDLPPIGSTEFAALALFRTDASGRVTKKEIVWVLDHVVGTSAATIVRGREGTTAQVWDIGDRWSHTQTARDITIICTSATRPVNPHIGLEIYESDTTAKRVWDGTAWQQIGGIPVGTVIWRPKVAAVPGYHRCDGLLYDRTTYADLFAYLGFSASPVPGTDPGSNQFYVPNTKGKVFVDLDAAQTEFATALLSGGNKASTAPHTHDLANHGHTQTAAAPSTNVSGGVINTAGWQGVGWVGGNPGTDRNHAHAFTTGGVSTEHWHGGKVGTNSGTHNHDSTDNQWAGRPTGSIFFTGGQNMDWAGQHTHGGGTGGHDTDHGHAVHDHRHGLEGHQHDLQNHSHANVIGAPSTNTSGASSAAATSGNLQPYMTMVAYIKF